MLNNKKFGIKIEDVKNITKLFGVKILVNINYGI